MGLLRTSNTSQPGVDAMWRFIKKIEDLTGTGDPQKALENWTANIELGVLVDRRKKGDDPKEHFDGSYLSGQATPRTEQLQQVDLLIGKAGSGSDVDWKIVVGLLEQTLAEHIRMTSELGRDPEKFTDPHLEMWTKTSDGFVRNKQKMTSTSGSNAMENELKTPLPRPTERVRGESGVASEITQSVVSFMEQYSYTLTGNLLVVTGKSWTCYVRCVLHHFGQIDKYDAIMGAIRDKGINIGSGVSIGSNQETRIIAIIRAKIGQDFWVHATNVSDRRVDQSRSVTGQQVSVLLTGAHFSLLS